MRYVGAMSPDQKVGVGVGVMVLRDGKVLLGKRNGDPAKASSKLGGAGTWTMPGGKVDYGETLEAAAKREVLEETGLHVGSLRMVSVSDDIGDMGHFVTIGFLCEDFDGEPEAKEPETINPWNWFALDDLPDPMYFPSVGLLKNYRAGQLVAAADK
jgi:8-oxo-dGTP diphosphatase